MAAALGVRFALPADATPGRDLVVHASASSDGLRLALGLLGFEGTVLELSWYGTRSVSLDLGGSFHSGRSTIRASQVGTIAPSRRSTRTHADRLAVALDLLRDPVFDALRTGTSPFEELPKLMRTGSLSALSHVITYGEE